ncbi:MAG: DUF1501 domain-containing protein [Proteobacteria bacterium]|nr:DUF1501 domain-containing protein [Pseudomonadota bacterium]MDA1301565.1 DUF1501 domain-containing protein [Pseudomonadota bacterium]
MITRRQLFSRTIALSAFAALSLSAPGLVLGRGEKARSRFVLMILRGGMDGLAAVPAYGDPHYRTLRGALALPDPDQPSGILDLDGHFGLHPSLKQLHELYRSGELAIIHGTAPPYQQRSHFDAQNVLECGADAPRGLSDGWLYRALTAVDSRRQQEDIAVAVGPSIPLVLRGEKVVGSWAPDNLPHPDDDTMSRILALYAHDTTLAPKVAAMMEMQSKMADMEAVRPSQNNRLKLLTEAAVRLLSDANGPAIAVLEVNGWDTHAAQGATTGRLANKLRGLDETLTSLRTGLGKNWQNTVVLAVTEFGRTVAANGTKGSDHGVGGAALLLGGAVIGGRVIADWQGLDPQHLHKGRDLPATIDQRQIFKAVLVDHLGADPDLVEDRVFPDSRLATRLPGLIVGQQP